MTSYWSSIRPGLANNKAGQCACVVRVDNWCRTPRPKKPDNLLPSRIKECLLLTLTRAERTRGYPSYRCREEEWLKMRLLFFCFVRQCVGFGLGCSSFASYCGLWELVTFRQWWIACWDQGRFTRNISALWISEISCLSTIRFVFSTWEFVE